MSYIVDLCGTRTQVSLSFFKFKEVRHEHIGDTHFINYGGITISIHDNTYKRVQMDLRDSKIDSILE